MNTAMRLPGWIGPHALLITTAAVPLTGWAVHAAALHRQLAASRRDPLTGLLRLWREAQVSRATMNRATAILTAWDSHVAKNGTTTPGEARRDDEITRLRRRLAEKTHECTLANRRLEAAAVAIAALHHDNTQLRQELSTSSGRVTSLHPHWTKQVEIK
ncbi:hypothetical protein [Streptomyces cavourensis]|uniref:Uncharacterized protein n=1 Tax=Streptomyces cavourensis TaxID=67258 RepID=A0ABY5FJ78_9ACTN|nr:hypothetical protein [Streptomyces cavourensis]UTR83665.1 hypothetical protein NLU04_34715 [Streptomyces cavourensis]